MIVHACRRGLLPRAWNDTMDMMGAPGGLLISSSTLIKSNQSSFPGYDNFIKQYEGSFEQPDSAFIPRTGPDRKRTAPFPSVVVESGWQESPTRNLEDARLWLEGSQNAVVVVPQAKLHNIDESGRIRLVLSILRAYPDALGLTISPTYYASFSHLPRAKSPVFITNLQILNIEYLSNPAAFPTKP